MSQVILNVHNVLKVLTLLNESNRDLDNRKFNFSDVRDTLLSYLIYNNALTSSTLLCPESFVSRLNWLRVVSNTTYSLYEIVEDTNHESIA